MENLLDTGDKTLVEAIYDDAWGTGQHLGSRDCLICSKWKSVGILGRIIMKIRSEMQASTLDETNSENMDTLAIPDRDDTNTTESLTS